MLRRAMLRSSRSVPSPPPRLLACLGNVSRGNVSCSDHPVCLSPICASLRSVPSGAEPAVCVPPRRWAWLWSTASPRLTLPTPIRSLPSRRRHRRRPSRRRRP
jgi:hypothetical protein